MIQELAIPNDNNKLHCHAFVQIGPEPARPFPEKSFDRVYSISVDGESRLYKLVDFLRMPFKDIGSVYTIPSAGMESFAWRTQYRQEHPEVTDDTPMAVYLFKREG